MSEIKKQALGRGLSALFGASSEDERESQGRASLTLPIDTIVPGRHQPRQSFPEEELMALAASIQERGVLQPILVRVHPEDKEKFEIVAGERRWRASKKAGLEHIPALVKDFSDVEALEVGLLENIQRQDLNPIEEAEGYRRLAEEFDHTQESLSLILGKSRSHIANTLRLLTLPKTVKEYLSSGKLSAGHGRALIGAEDPESLAKTILERNLSVRQAEVLGKQKQPSHSGLHFPNDPDPEKERLQQHLSDLLGVRVELSLKGMGGKITISFQDPAELDFLVQKFNRLLSPPPKSSGYLIESF